MLFHRIESFKYGLICCIACIPLLLQAVPVSVRQLPIDRLPSNSAQRVYQDREGYIWIGTGNGLFRYDGYRLLSFRSDHTCPDLLTDNAITYFAEDETCILIGTEKGMNLLDRKTCNIRPLDNDEVRQAIIKSICVTSDRNIWVGTTGGLYRFNPDYSFRKKYDSLPVQSVCHIFEDAQKNLWAGIWSNGLYRYRPESDDFLSFPPVGTGNTPFRIFQDHRNQLWIGTWDDGIYLFNPDKTGDEMYVPLKTFNRARNTHEHTFYSFAQDDHNRYIWAMSLSGIYAFDYAGNGSLRQTDVSPLFRHTNNTFSEITKGKDGNLWIGTFREGILQVGFDELQIQNYYMQAIKDRIGIETCVTAICKDGDEIWFNQDRFGLGVYNLRSGELNLYNHRTSEDLDVSQIKCISAFDSYPGEIWLATAYRAVVYRVKKEGNRLIRLHTIDLDAIATSSGEAHILFEDSRNNIWIACRNRLFFLPSGSGDVIPVDGSFAAISGIVEDAGGEIWIGSAENGLYRISPTDSHSDVRHYATEITSPASNRITSLCADKDGKIWLATKDGSLIVHNTLNGQSTDLTRSINLIDDRIFNLTADDFGNIWMATDRKIIVYNPDNGASRDFTETDGVGVNSFFPASCCKDRSGKLLFGGNRGISVFNTMEKLPECASKNNILFTDVKINNRSLLDGRSNRKFNLVNRYLEIDPDDKNIEINFSSFNYTYPSKIRYAYKLEGKDGDWIYAGKNRRFAAYNQLGKGKYSLKVKATDENGIWSTKEAVLTIYRRPAWYETILAYSLYTLTAILLLYLAFIHIRKRIRRANRQKIDRIEKNKQEELNRLKFRFFTNISHEFRTPLSLIISPLEALIKKEPDEQHKEKLSKIHKNAKDLLSLVNQLLDFRKLEMKGEELHTGYGDLVEFTETFYPAFKEIADNEQKDISLSVPEEPLYMFFDRDKLHKILNNLLSNAFKYTSTGDSIALSLERMKTNNREYAVIKVSDTGVGIPPESAGKIFDRFHQLENAVNTTSGSGIGLHLVKEYVNLHGGHVSVESAPGKGSVFTVMIPSRFENSPPPQPPEIAVKTAEKRVQKAADKRKILLVEDNSEFRQFLTEQLSASFRVVEASDGEEGEQTALKELPDLIITDIVMPKINGTELCTRIKTNIRTSHIPVIMLTARASDEYRLTGYEAGADEYISKPFNLDILMLRIQKLIEQKEYRKEKFRKTVDFTPASLTITSLDEHLMQKALAGIEKNIDRTEYSIDDLSADVGLSRANLYRKIQSVTGETPAGFIRLIRLKRAAQLLADTALNVSEIADMSGFNSIKYFNKHFKDTFGFTPTQYRNKDQA